MREMADYLRVSRVTVWRWCKQGLIPALQIGRIWRIWHADLLNLEEKLVNGNGSIPNSFPY